MANLLIVDDDPALRGLLTDLLETAGHRIRAVADGAGLRQALVEQDFDLVLLDVGLPGEDGLSLARQLRDRHQLGIVMLTGADQLIDRVAGLEVGADDYVAKPFSPAELKARIAAVLRRRLALRERMQPLGGGIVDLQQWRMLDRNGAPVPLTEAEMDLVAAFASHVGQVLTREALLRLAPARDGEAFDRSIDSRLARLRRKLEAHSIVLRIQPVRGVGYRLEDSAPIKMQGKRS